MALNPELIDILACPTCKGELELLQDKDGLLCKKCSKIYPIENEVPVMLEDEAVAEGEWKKR